MCGRAAMRAVATSPTLKLVGARVFAHEKVGQDAGVLCGLQPTDVRADDDEEAILALEADCVLWMGAATMFMPGADVAGEIAGLCRILKSGKNVISIVHTPFVHPNSLPQEMRAPIEEACRLGDVSFHATGIDPGFVSEVLALTLSGISRQIHSLTIQEIAQYSHYGNAPVLFDVMGFGRPPQPDRQLGFGERMARSFGSSLRLIGDGLGAPVDDVRPYVESRVATEDLTVAVGLIERGTIAALRYGFQGLVSGAPRFTIERIARVHEDVAPDWPQGDGHRILLQGQPNVSVSFAVGAKNEPKNIRASSWAAVMRAINVIPAVCAANPGIRTVLDLPLICGQAMIGVQME